MEIMSGTVGLEEFYEGKKGEKEAEGLERRKGAERTEVGEGREQMS